LHAMPKLKPIKKGQVEIIAHSNTESLNVKLEMKQGEWLVEILNSISIYKEKVLTLQEIQADFEKSFDDFEIFWFSKVVKRMRKFGVVEV